MPFGTLKEALPCVGKRNSLSICMIVKNEEANIGRAIQSFLPFADEIIVNDTGSTDKTIEIVQSFPKTVLMQSEWIGDFSYSRNLSLEKASCSWILWMDADDYVPPEQVDAFNKLKLTPLDRMIQFTVCNTTNGKPMGLRFMQARMFPNHPKMRFEGRIHESIIRPAENLGLNPVNTNIEIWHMGYETLEIRKKKANRNLELQLADPEHDKRIEGLIELGDSYSVLDETEKAIDYYRRASEMICPILQIDLKMNALNKLGRHLSELDRFEEAKEVFEKCLKQFPKSEEAYFGLAKVLVSQDKRKESMVFFRKLLTMKAEISTGGTNFTSIKHNCLKNLILWELEQKNFKLAKNYAEQMQREYKDDPEAKLLFEQASMALQSKHDKRPLLSLCMIVKNEEKNIGECLKSVEGLADEIIVTDTGSTDKTVEIAQSYGAKIEHFEWIRDFSAARNHSISKATSKWIIWLDADDRLPKRTVEELRKILSSESANKVFHLVVCNSRNDDKTGVHFSQIRIFPNNSKIRFEGRIHEQILSSIRKCSLIEVKLPLEVFHTGYENPDILREKQLRNLELFKEEFPNPMKMDPNAMYHYATSHEITGDYENAILWFKNALEKAKVYRYDEFLILIPQNVARILEHLGRNDEAMGCLNQSLIRDPYFEPAISQKARILAGTGQTQEAVKWYGYMTTLIPKISTMPTNEKLANTTALQFLAEYWNTTGQTPLAISILKMLKELMLGTASLNPFALAEIYVAHNKAEEAIDNLDFLKSGFDDKPEFAFLDGQALALAGKVQQAIETVSKAKEQFPQNADIAELAKAMGI
ncbi:MAG: glycosyltransferase [Fibromonadaceae bacterium]|nr:glycosyltransferase [Fibromonadaceae bacterium]